MIHLHRDETEVQPVSQLESIPFAIDYIRVQGPARLLLRQRFGIEMRNFLAALPRPLDIVARIGMATDIGTRPRNEDSSIALMGHFGDRHVVLPVILAGVADGLGGDVDGHVASAIAIHVLTERIVDWLDAIGKRMNGTDLTTPSIEGILLEAIRVAHHEIQAKTSGGSSTLTCALIIDRTAYIAHIGDSRAYLLNREWKDIELITQDHRRERQWQEFNIASSEQFEPHPKGHVLYRSLGKGEQCEVDLTRRNLVNDSRLLLCTNGIWDVVSPEANFTAVHQPVQPQDVCEGLVTLALANSGHDDMTAVLVEIPAS